MKPQNCLHFILENRRAKKKTDLTALHLTLASRHSVHNHRLHCPSASTALRYTVQTDSSHQPIVCFRPDLFS
jgi:hypothetical protein